MGKLAAWALLAVALVAGGFAAGWHWKGVSVDAAGARGDRQALTDLTENVNQQIAAHLLALADQQNASARWIAEQRLLQAGGATIQLEISHAVLTKPGTPGVTASCPDPSASPEFVRLYHAAATAGDTAHSGSAGSGGVSQGRVPGLQ